MTETVLQNLQARRQQLLSKVAELDQSQQLAMLNVKVGRISIEQANIETAKIAAERIPVAAVLESTDAILGEMIAGLPIELKVADVCDIICLFENAFQQKSPSGAAVVALDRLRKLARKETK
jgi:hypothetical protein